MFDEMRDCVKMLEKTKDFKLNESNWENLFCLLYCKINSLINEFEECEDDYIKSDIEETYKEYVELIVKLNELYKNRNKD